MGDISCKDGNKELPKIVVHVSDTKKSGKIACRCDRPLRMDGSTSLAMRSWVSEQKDGTSPFATAVNLAPGSWMVGDFLLTSPHIAFTSSNIQALKQAVSCHN
jgi:hypothetical protein